MRIILLQLAFICTCTLVFGQNKPNVIIIYTDDLGYGDLSCYGATKLNTPNIDALLSTGVKFTNAHSTAATCTPSRYSLMTGKYPFRKTGTGVLSGDAALIIDTNDLTLPKVFKEVGYVTGLVGKWHLGLGNSVSKDWNEKIAPGPLEVGFDYSFIFPATADRVPTVFVENHSVVGVNENDPIAVSYVHKIGSEPTGKENPELLKMNASANHGHDNTIVNGIGRIGWMEGGKDAKWTDEELTFTFLNKAVDFINVNKDKSFFLSYNATEPHVHRMPATMFKGKSGLGFRGDAILQLDYTVGQITSALKNAKVYDNTIIIFSSDNGPVLDDGYDDGAVTQLNGHDPFGGLRGGKYSIYEAGTRVPFIVSWPQVLKGNQLSNALISQVDLLASFDVFLSKRRTIEDLGLDSQPMWDALTGSDEIGRKSLIKSAGTKAIIAGDYKYIEPSNGPVRNDLVNIELGNSQEPQLYNLRFDMEEKNNLAKDNPKIVNELKSLLDKELK